MKLTKHSYPLPQGALVVALAAEPIAPGGMPSASAIYRDGRYGTPDGEFRGVRYWIDPLEPHP
jgi:hypothetical protein